MSESKLDESYGYLAMAYAALYRRDIEDRVPRPKHLNPGVSWTTKQSRLRNTIIGGILELAVYELTREELHEFLYAADDFFLKET